MAVDNTRTGSACQKNTMRQKNASVSLLWFFKPLGEIVRDMVLSSASFVDVGLHFFVDSCQYCTWQVLLSMRWGPTRVLYKLHVVAKWRKEWGQESFVDGLVILAIPVRDSDGGRWQWVSPVSAPDGATLVTHGVGFESHYKSAFFKSFSHYTLTEFPSFFTLKMASKSFDNPSIPPSNDDPGGGPSLA